MRTGWCSPHDRRPVPKASNDRTSDRHVRHRRVPVLVRDISLRDRFRGNLPVPQTVDVGAAVPIAQAVAVNALLLALFAAQHSVMGRVGFKRFWTRDGRMQSREQT
jgi:hypothetical protein